ncbi:MAG: gfo/Idh/MocA family oxidoreductase [Planctomycetota bacterium]|nr:MAG: gfo/Idh/MocA family oxidoreductase [Planctomycetota bacterium]
MDETSRRRFLGRSLLTAAMAAAAPAAPVFSRVRGRRPGPNERVRLGVIGVRGRGRAHIGGFKNLPEAEVAVICDCDEGVIGPAMKSVPDARYVKDLRRLLDDDSIDAVTIATPNHWHSLAAIWALQAGKHVYVEKPMSHVLFEGRKLVDAAAKYRKVVQVGTQARSQPATREAMQWLREGGLGEVRLAWGLCYKRRQSIGKVDGPQQPPPTIDYDLWTGPAALLPLMRRNLHYDWHWVWNTGNGDIGNQGVHQMDIARWGLGLDRHPLRVRSVGGRLGYDDDGETPNTQLALLDYGDREVVFEVRGLETKAWRGASIGVVFEGEKGFLVSASYERLQAFDPDGKPLREFRGRGDHFADFLAAVRSDAPAAVHAPPSEGHLSAAMGHLANVSWRLGEERLLADAAGAFPAGSAAADAFGRMAEHLAANGLPAADTRLVVGPELTFDGGSERFRGPRAEEADRLLRRPPRPGFEVPEEV